MSSSCGHKIEALPDGRYRLIWVVSPRLDGGGRMPPRRCHRETDRRGAERFAHRWGIPGPWEPSAPTGTRGPRR